MRSISNLPPVYTVPTGRAVKGAADGYAVQPVQTRGAMTSASDQGRVYDALLEERRRARRRLNQQAMLVELRSGLERRRNPAEGEEAGRIDEEA
jgi:hypothetical protein